MRLSVHFQGFDTWARDAVRASAMQYVKMIDPPMEDPFPGKRTIGRTYMKDEESNALIWQGQSGAQTWFNRFYPTFDARRWVHAWEGPNEPQPMADANFCKKLDEFTCVLINLMHGKGLRLVGMNWSVGWPDVGNARDFPSVGYLDYLGLHEYSAPAMWDNQSWYCLRYRRTVQELKNAGIAVPPILVGECGIDGGVIGRPKTGWKTFCQSESQYEEQLAWYDDELVRDGITAAFVFTAGPAGEWQDFEVNPTLVNWLAERSWQPEHTPVDSQIVFSETAPVNPCSEPPPIVNLVGKLPVHPTKTYDTRPVPKYTVAHHSGAEHKYDDERAVQSIAAYHIRRWDWPGIGYHFVISKSGMVYRTNKIETMSFHSGRPMANKSGIGVCLLGNYLKARPPDVQLGAAKRLLSFLGLPVKLHKDIIKTACPGTITLDDLT